MLNRQTPLSHPPLPLVLGLFLVLLAGGLCLAVKPSLATDTPRLALNDVSVELQNQSLRLRSSLVLESADTVRKELQDGAQMGLTCTLFLERVNTFRNSEVARTTSLFMLRHDPLTREFVMSSGDDKFQLRYLAPLIEQGWRKTPLELPLPASLEPGEYRLTLHLTLEYTDVPPWLARTLFFWSWEVASPLTYTQTFRL